MRQQISVVAACLLSISFYCANSQSLDWQFDPFSTDQWFKQKLDHFDSSIIQHWPQRYVTSYRFYRLGGPIFLYLSGPGPELSLTDIETGAIASYAEEQGAFVIGLEHRYYGKSRPTTDLSRDNLNYLTIPQTLEDIAAFVRDWRGRDEFRNSKWVVFGASYLGSVAAWFAQKHPELIDAFVASSAPLELRYEIPEFLENVGLAINETNPKCYDTVADGFACLSKIFNEEKCENYTLEGIKDVFNFCADLDRTRPLDATGVFAELFSTINAVVMYHDPSPDSFPDTNLDRFCKHVTAESDGKSALDKIGEKVKEINEHRGVECAEFRFQTTVDFLKEKEWDSPAAKEGYRQLQWQLCNELGWTVASANLSQPFGNYLTPFLHSEICQNLFGLTETEMRLKVLKANTDLKGKSLNTQCGIYVNGNKDPWHTFSITTAEEAGKCNRAILIDGGSHGRDVEDFTITTESFPAQVRDAQLKIASYLDHWLKTGSCCEEESAESRRVIATISRPARAPKDYYSGLGNLQKRPNVGIVPCGYPVENRQRVHMSPTSIPYQVSTTDVLSVSPRIPVAGSSSSMDETLERVNIRGNIFRDPNTSELRRYRVVKLLRHRQPFAPPTPEPNLIPSMEEFEADFPEHSIRIEGRVERVFKNGTAIPSTESPRSVVDEQLYLFDKGRRRLQQLASSNELAPEGISQVSPEKSESGDRKKFKYVVRKVFKSVVNVENISKSAEAQQSRESMEISDNPMKANKRHSLEDGDVKAIKEDHKTPGSALINASDEDNESLSTSFSEEQGLFEESSSSNLKSSSEESSANVTTAQVRKLEGKETTESSESSDGDSISTSESIEHLSTKPAAPNSAVNNTENKKQKQSTGNKITDKEDYNSEEKYDEDDDEYYDDDYYSDETGSTVDEPKNKTKNITQTKNNSSKEAKISTEFTSGEDNRARRLREKISQKIMASSEHVQGDQKSKEKTNSKTDAKSKKGNNSNDSKGKKEGSLESTEELFSSEEYNYSLEPSGSNPSRSYKKQLAPISKPVYEDPSTIINVKISGSYPKSASHSRKKSRKRTERKQLPKNVTSAEESNEDGKSVRIKKTQRKKKVHSSGRVNSTAEATRKKTKKTIVTTTSTTTTLPPSSQQRETARTSGLQEQSPVNNYAMWNKGKGVPQLEAIPVQQEAPTIVPLDTSSPTQANDDNKDVMYIIIGDIPLEDESSINNNNNNENPSHQALFNFIQKLVNRHSPGMFTPGNPPSPTTTTTTTTTTTQAPPLPPPTQSIMSRQGYMDHSGKYLLVRPVHVIPLGRDHVVHEKDLKNDSLIDLMTMETPSSPYPYLVQNMKRQNSDLSGDYRFKSPLHRDHFERLLSVDGQMRDSDRDFFTPTYRRLDQVPDPSWRSIRGLSQFGPVVPPQKSNTVSGLLSLSAADTQWVNEGVPFLPRGRQVSSRSHNIHQFGRS